MLSTHAQCTATLEHLLIEVDKIIASSGSDPLKQAAKRALKDILKTLHAKKKPSKDEVKNLVKACNTIRAIPMRMPEIHNHLYDVEDFVERL